MGIAEDITFRIGANAQKFKGEMNGAVRFAKGAGAAIAAAFSVDAIKQAVSDVADIADKAQRAAVTSEILQEIRFAGEQTGVTLQAVDVGLQRFARRIAEIRSGSENDLSKVLKANNVELKDAEGNFRTQADILSDYADLIKNAGSETDKTRLAFLAFDSEGVALVNTLKNGSDGLNEMRGEARDLGLVLSEDTVEAAQELDREFAKATAKMNKLWQRFVVNVVGGVDSMLVAAGKLSSGLYGQSIQQLETELSGLKKQLEDAPDGIEGFFGGFATGGGRTKITIQDEIDKITARLKVLKTEATSTKVSISEVISPTIIPNKNDDDKGGGKGGGSSGSRRRSAAEAQREADAIRRVIEQLQFELVGLSQTEEQRRIANELRAAGVDAASAEGQAIAQLVTMIEAEERARDALKNKAQEDERRRGEIADSYNQIGQSALDAAASVAEGSQKGSAALKQFAIEMAIAAAQAAFLGQGPLAALFGGASNPTNFAGSAISSVLSRRYAQGGIATQASIFGEAGPEAAVPLPDGRRIPVSLDLKSLPMMPGDMARQQAPSIVYAPVHHNDNRGADVGAMSRLENGQKMRDKTEFSRFKSHVRTQKLRSK